MIKHYLLIITLFFQVTLFGLTQVEENQIQGALHDDRPNEIIAKDMLTNEPTVSSICEWLQIGPESVDLHGWDDRTIPDKMGIIKDEYKDLKKQVYELINKEDYLFSRVKTLPSIVGKLKEKNRHERVYVLSDFPDLAAFRVVVQNLNEIPRISQSIEDLLHVIVKKDYIANPKPDGYRSIHYVIDYQGDHFEIQVRTIGMDLWGEWSHDLFYKNKQLLLSIVGPQKFAEFEQYAFEVSNYIFDIERGLPATPPRPPEGSAILWEIASDHTRLLINKDGTLQYEKIKMGIPSTKNDLDED